MEVATLWGGKKSTIIKFKEYDPISLQIRGRILHFTNPPTPHVHDYQQTYFTNPIYKFTTSVTKLGVQANQARYCLFVEVLKPRSILKLSPNPDPKSQRPGFKLFTGGAYGQRVER
jgi:hypothetical protein